MSSDVLSYRPSPERRMLLDRHRVDWKSFCDMNIDSLKEKKNNEFFDRIALRVLLIALGATVFCLSFLFNNLVIVFLEFVVSSVLILIGSVSLFVMYWRGRRERVGRG